MPTASDCEPAPKTIATSGIIVSGSAVPTAARTEPTAPSASPSRWPNHSTAFVNSSAPTRMTRERADEQQEGHRAADDRAGQAALAGRIRDGDAAARTAGGPRGAPA